MAISPPAKLAGAGVAVAPRPVRMAAARRAARQGASGQACDQRASARGMRAARSVAASKASRASTLLSTGAPWKLGPREARRAATAGLALVSLQSGREKIGPPAWWQARQTRRSAGSGRAGAAVV